MPVLPVCSGRSFSVFQRFAFGVWHLVLVLVVVLVLERTDRNSCEEAQKKQKAEPQMEASRN
jgi:hypothetical protein